MSTESDRRSFLKTAAAVSIAVAGSSVGEASSPRPVRMTEPAGDGETPAQMLSHVVRARFSEHLRDAEMPAIIEELEGNLRAAAGIRRVPLQNSDEPCTIFLPERPGI